VTGNVLVQSGVTLRVGAGDRILFDGLYYIKVDGTILAEGVDSRRIIFTSHQTNPAPGDWIGIRLTGSTQSVISFSTIEYAGGTGTIIPGALNLSGGPHLVDNAVIQQNQRYPLVLGNGNNTVQNSILINNDISGELISIEGGIGTTTFINNTLISNTASTIIAVTKDGGTHQLKDNNFESNMAYQSIVYVESADVEIYGNSFIDNIAGPNNGSGIVKIQNSPISSTISCNLFTGNQATGQPPQPGGVIYIMFNNGNVFVTNNTILPGLGDYDITVGSGEETSINATENYWATSDPNNISERIYDFFDDFNLVEVIFNPFLLVPPSCAPIKDQ